MKKSILFLVVFVLAVIAAFAQEPDTVVTIPGGGGFSEFYEKYSAILWSILGLLGVTAFLTYRTARVKDALNVIIEAAQDGHVTEAEFQAIVAAIKKIWGKKSE